LIIFERSTSFKDDFVHLRTRVTAIWDLVSVNVEWSAEGIEPGVRLHEKENDVAEEEQLQRLQVKLSPAGEVLGGQQAGPGYQSPKAPKET